MLVITIEGKRPASCRPASNAIAINGVKFVGCGSRRVRVAAAVRTITNRMCDLVFIREIRLGDELMFRKASEIHCGKALV